ncbi:hypothetical protein EDEG_00997 [Edhazardia aedis USNM 41457]|uniref:Uncharacterized protein n=1 Tax=Edhazardia aedis (strain USNM 41457) TaxID=1003232 RepID=J9DU32_EDHAE|nr:hypothetical protein EDEG_00997 [Edhazardia aedis USNM 41457]|eukprot:EJW04807.1 hypothetical protein EDEG_00997 [Edhazardia aedis USNM 41457]
MRTKFKENQILCEMEDVEYDKVFKNTVGKFKSKKIIRKLLHNLSLETVEEKVVQMFKFLDFTYENDYEYVLLTNKIDLISFLLAFGINNNNFNLFNNFFSRFEDFGELKVLENEQKLFLSENFNNYYIYKKIYCNYDFDEDIIIEESSIDEDKKNRFYELFKIITLRNKNNLPMLKYFRNFKNTELVCNFFSNIG